ncbi:cytochrome c oxidase accessory protein CcoG [Bremerella cremea]|uniref:cytochrome c oxidase accessory protein CcoG n=1 Tax=Bremerella cremea TaxID=1031537 RepID=UPI0031ECEE18
MSDELLTPDEHVLSTLESDGSRRWLFPRVSLGKYWHARRIVGFALIAIFVAIPHVRLNNKPLVLLDITERQFTIFGYTFLPSDTLLLALLMISVFLTIFLLTALLGRVWCGWACPQTVYLEFVYRPIERFFMGTSGRGGVPSKSVPAYRKVAMYAVYLVLSMALAHTFLAYFVGTDRLRQWVTQSPFEHPGPFIVMALTTGLMMFDFVFFREQLCLIACPYGRFQSVLLDRNSLIVAYDHVRGEPRGKRKQGQELPIVEEPQGDCIDCKLCVRTCPTGIDIRDGLQMECVHCTQCVDACDEIMTRINKPTGLIRYSSQEAIETGVQRFLRPRVFIYPTLLAIVVSILAYNIINKKSFDVTLIRGFGLPYSVNDAGQIENRLQVKLVNRLEEEDTFQMVLEPNILQLDGNGPTTIAAGASETISFVVIAERKDFVVGKIPATLKITSEKTQDERSIQCRIFGP